MKAACAMSNHRNGLSLGALNAFFNAGRKYFKHQAFLLPLSAVILFLFHGVGTGNA